MLVHIVTYFNNNKPGSLKLGLYSLHILHLWVCVVVKDDGPTSWTSRIPLRRSIKLLSGAREEGGLCSSSLSKVTSSCHYASKFDRHLYRVYWQILGIIMYPLMYGNLVCITLRRCVRFTKAWVSDSHLIHPSLWWPMLLGNEITINLITFQAC